MFITCEYVRSILDYNEKTGVLTWKKRPEEHFKSKKVFAIWNGKYSGKVAGCNHTNQNGKKYRLISIDNRRYLEHRVIWLLVHGIEPRNEIDHINGNGLDNRIENLRDITRGENNKNIKLSKRNKSGFVGVSFDKAKGKYKAEIGLKGKTKFIGYFSDFTQACEARKKAEIKCGFHANHGS